MLVVSFTGVNIPQTAQPDSVKLFSDKSSQKSLIIPSIRMLLTLSGGNLVLCFKRYFLHFSLLLLLGLALFFLSICTFVFARYFLTRSILDLIWCTLKIVTCDLHTAQS